MRKLFLGFDQPPFRFFLGHRPYCIVAHREAKQWRHDESIRTHWATAKEITKTFGRVTKPREDRIEEILETLAALGKARQLSDTRYIAVLPHVREFSRTAESDSRRNSSPHRIRQ
jgi:hypothetical protein